MTKFKAFYLNNIGLNKFLYSSFILCVMGDLVHAVYAKKVWLSKGAFHQLFLKMLVANQIDPRTLSVTDIAEGEGLLYMTIWTMLIVFIIVNAFFYFLFAQRRPSGIAYTRFMVVTSLIITVLGFFGEMMNLNVWSLANLLQIAIYSFVTLGFYSFDELKKSAK